MIDRRISASDKELKAPSTARYPAQLHQTRSLGPSATCPVPLAAQRGGRAGRARLRYTRRMTRGWRRPLGRVVGPVLAAALLVGGCSGDGQQAEPTPSRWTSPATSASPGPSAPERSLASSPQASTSTAVTPTADAGGAPEVAVSGSPPSRGPVRLERWFDRELSGGGLRLGAERERASAYRSYNVSYRSQDLRISGVINVPRGRGPFPAVVLAHGYIDPAIYVRGQGMPRERRSLASAGYIALHVDYRNHAASDDDPALQRTARLGYSVDLLNAVLALRATDAVPVDDDRIALMGRSMGGGVVYRALQMAPGLVDAGVVFASVSSDEADNYAQFSGPSPYWEYIRQRWGTPESNPAFWEGISADQHSRPRHGARAHAPRHAGLHLPAPVGSAQPARHATGGGRRHPAVVRERRAHVRRRRPRPGDAPHRRVPRAQPGVTAACLGLRIHDRARAETYPAVSPNPAVLSGEKRRVRTPARSRCRPAGGPIRGPERLVRSALPCRVPSACPAVGAGGPRHAQARRRAALARGT